MSDEAWGTPVAKPLDEMTVKELDGLIGETFELERQMDGLKTQQKNLQLQIDEYEKKILAYLMASGKKSYPTAAGTVTFSQRLSVKVPKEPEAREAFFGYLKNQGIFEDMITVNSQTLNAYFKQEWEVAKSENRASEFSLPGIGPPTFSDMLVKKKK